MHNSKIVTGSNFFRLQIWTEVLDRLGLQNSNTTQVRLYEMVVWNVNYQKCVWSFIKSILK